MSWGVNDSPCQRGPATPRIGDTGSCMDFLNLKRPNHDFKGQIWQKISHGCNEVSLLDYIKVWEKGLIKSILLTPRYHQWRSRFLIINISMNSKSKSESRESLYSAKDLCRPDLCKKNRKNRFIAMSLLTFTYSGSGRPISSPTKGKISCFEELSRRPGSVYRNNLSLIWTIFCKRDKARKWMIARE